MSQALRRNPSGGGPDDAELVRAAQGGDAPAFTEIVRRYQHSVHRVAWALTRNDGDADDVAQETFVRAWRALGRFRVGEPLYPWLARIATNLAFSMFRSRKRRPETPLEPLLEAGRQWGVEDDPAERVAAGERSQHLQRAFAELKPEHQTILALRVVEEQSYEAIAETLGVPIGTVMSRLSRARAELKTRLAARTGEGT
ncbi:MAG: sigma-70 family RNA polymerase sigma factor [Candidatus Eisenbacteria bacterium]|nr:sigma-70 family RNA polymerase sigma factor [Candidatus Eisenbacteria bacterium]